MAKWNVIEGELTVKFQPTCDYHLDKPENLEALRFQKLHFEFGEGIGHAIDVYFMCPYCGAYEIFGVALSKEEHNSLLGESHDSQAAIGRANKAAETIKPRYL